MPRSFSRVRCVLLACLVLVLISASGSSALAPRAAQGQPLPPPVASYRMDVRLDPASKTVAGTERITYRNPSEDILSELWLRLYLRAFRSPDTLWMQESGGGARGFAADPAQLGDITVTELNLADGPDLLASAVLTDTLMRVPLPAPLGPGESVEIDAAWTSKLPRVFARTGYGGRDDTFFMVGQWYPKMAVYDRGRWDTEPWHANAEFFHDFGSYDVSVTVPTAYVVAGAGVPAGETVAGESKTVRFTANNLTDFAFAASPDFRTRAGKAGATEVALFYLPEHEAAVEEYMAASIGSLQALGDWYGPYPFPRLTVVDVPDDAGGAGGMEYPTLITGGTLGLPAAVGTVSVVVAHEVAHQWWPMQTATDEGREPWLDEGLAEYSGSRYLYEVDRRIGLGAASISSLTLDRSQYAVAPNQSATLPAWEYDQAAYGAAAYSKPALGLWTLESVVGVERFRDAMADYLRRYRWTHPTAADFRSSLEQSLDEDLSWFFDDYLAGSGGVDFAAGAIQRSPTGSAVTIERQGAARVPVDVLLETASGAQRTERWDGRDQATTFTNDAADPVVRVELDPEQKLKAELDLLDNGASLQPQLGPTTTLGGRLSFWTQLVIQILGLFG